MPLANLWYTKAATDHLVFHQFQEFFSPGYLKRMRTRARNEFDQEFWWEPGERVPDRAPDLERALGDERRSEEHTSELQSLMRISYAVFCLKKKKQQQAH